jgi:predicted naringenin-chalcone synthase
LANIINIGTAVPAYKHQQKDILAFMQNIYQLPEKENRVLKFLYDHSGIESRYSIIPDYSYTYPKSNFIPDNRTDVFPLLEERMKLYETQALDLSVTAINKAIDGYITPQHITHLITISCTGMSAPGLDLQLMELLHLAPDIFRSSINFMGCYAAIHGLKMAKMICDSTPNANVVIVATEICTLHFQKEYSEDNAASSLLFADGAAAVFISNQITSSTALQIDGFYATVANKGKDHMAWELSSKGFLMRLSSYIPQLIESDINALVAAAMEATGNKKEAITDWCIHPGGKRILDLIEKKLGLADHDLLVSREVLQEHGNMSSPTVLFVLKKLMERSGNNKANMMGMAFGPGLTMETFFVSRL